MRLLTLALCLAAGTAAASEYERVGPVRHDLTRKECGSCHMAFQAGLLPAAAWDAVMADLGRHYGDDAGLPADKAAAIRGYLTANAGSGRRGPQWSADTLPRITTSAWFERKHRKVPASAIKDPKVTTLSNCPACHQGAEQGYYEDD